MLKELAQTLEPRQISQDPEVLKKYALDWTRIYPPRAAAVLFPETSQQVQKIVQAARKTRTPLVPSGGRTGLSAGAVATNGEIVVSFEKMNKILEVREIDRTIRCQAGAITEEVQRAAQDSGLYFPVDFASRGSSQIGGNIATNAGGVKVIRYGVMRDWVLGLQVVTGAGELLNLTRDLIKDNSGYDLRSLFIGSEGTLGFITEATLRLTNPPEQLSVILLSTQKLSNALKILTRFRNAVSLTAFEFFTEKALQYVLESDTQLSRPFQNSAPYYILLEFETQEESAVDRALEAFEECSAEGLTIEGTISQSSQQAETFWKYRENISEALSKHKPYKNDISVRISDIPNFVDEAEKLFSTSYPKTEIIWFGHIGDGNLHINVLKSSNESEEAFIQNCRTMSDVLFKLLDRYGGSVSAEHGIGLTKKAYLHYRRRPEEIALMKSVKKVFDPDLILNPGKIFDI